MSDDEQITDILTNTETIAVVGCSRKPGKPAHDVPRYLKNQGYEIVPVNPNAEEILGKKAFPDLESAAAEVEAGLDLVDVFRPSETVVPIAVEAVEVKASVLWLQLGIRNDEARSIAGEAGLQFVQDRCLKVEHRRLLAG